MSYYKDFYEPEPPQVYGDPKNRIWVTKNGVKIKVDKMTTEHINRLLKLGFYPPNDKWESIFREELERRSNIPKRTIDPGEDTIFSMSYKLKDLFEELGCILHGIEYGHNEMKWYITFPDKEEYKLVLEKASHIEGK